MMDDMEHKIVDLERKVEICRNDVGERMLSMERETLTKLIRLETQMQSVSAALATFVNHSQFAPVKLIAYGLAAGVLTTVLGAVLSKIIIP
jgi:hypothetical protein